MHLVISTIILATAASTFSTIELNRKTNGTIIPLTKRSSWLKLGNCMDFDALHSHVESVDAKILRGLENYERNTGITHSLAVKGTEFLNLKKRAVGAAALTNHEKFVWYGTITIGTPPQSFTVDFDTGFSDLFLAGPGCSGCSEHARWDPASSRTAETKDSVFHAGFDDGTTVSGKLYTDNVTIAGLTADIQTIGAASTYSTNIGFPPDGVLGMAFQSISFSPARPLFETLVDEGKVTEPVFSIKLTSDGGELYVGGTNAKLYEGEITYTPVTTVGFWQVKINEIQGDYETILEDVTAIIDTGANVIVGDQAQVADLHRTLGAKNVNHGYYSFPCDDFPTISFVFGGGATVEIPTSILNMGPIWTDSPDCFSGIVGRGKRAQWTLGSVFLQSVYSVFDFGNKRVGFADVVSYD